MMATKRDYYDVLGVDRNSSTEEIKRHTANWRFDFIPTRIPVTRPPKTSSRNLAKHTRC